VTKVLSPAFITVTISGLFLNLLFGFSLSQLLGMITGIQVANHYPMLRIDSPPNLGLMQAVIRKVNSFDFELGDLIKENIWGFTDEE